MSLGKALSKNVFSRDTLKKFENFTPKVSFEETFSKFLNLS